MYKNNKKTFENKLKELSNSFKTEKNTIFRNANQWVKKPTSPLLLQSIYVNHWFNDDLAILASGTGIGKTILTSKIKSTDFLKSQKKRCKNIHFQTLKSLQV